MTGCNVTSPWDMEEPFPVTGGLWLSGIFSKVLSSVSTGLGARGVLGSPAPRSWIQILQDLCKFPLCPNQKHSWLEEEVAGPWC